MTGNQHQISPTTHAFPISLGVIISYIASGKYDDAKSLMGNCKIDLAWKNHHILQEYCKDKKNPKTGIEWILKEGNYQNKHKEIALCMFAFLGKDKELKELIKSGVNHEPPPQGWEKTAINYCLDHDNSTCFETLFSHSTYPMLSYGMLEASKQKKPQCFIKGLAYIPNKDSLLITLWDNWSKSLIPKEVQKAILKRVHPLVLDQLLVIERNSTKGLAKGDKDYNGYTAKELAILQEVAYRRIKEKTLIEQDEQAHSL